jgi:hypothetical protein
VPNFDETETTVAQSMTSNTSKGRLEFPWKGMVYPAIGLNIAWALVFVYRPFDHATGGILGLLLIPSTLVVVALLMVRVDRAHAILKGNPALRTPRNICSFVIAFFAIVLPIVLLISTGG